MEEKIYHGGVQAADVANALYAEFNRPPWKVQKLAHGNKIAVQIATRPQARSGGQTALTVTLQQLSNGIMVQMGQQAWVGLAASLGKTAFAALMNPWNLLSRLDDLAQDIESMQLSERVWQVVDEACQLTNASHTLEETLDKTLCEYCGTANDLEASHCIACGAPLGIQAPQTCPHCGFPVPPENTICPHCQKAIH